MDNSFDDSSSDDFPDDDDFSEDNNAEIMRDESFKTENSCVDNVMIVEESLPQNDDNFSDGSIPQNNENFSNISIPQNEENFNESITYEKNEKDEKCIIDSEIIESPLEILNQQPEDSTINLQNQHFVETIFNQESSTNETQNDSQQIETIESKSKSSKSRKSSAHVSPTKIEKSPKKSIDVTSTESENIFQSTENIEIPPIIEEAEKPKKRAGRSKKSILPEEITNVEIVNKSKRRKKSPTPKESDDDIVLQSVKRNSRKRIRIIESDSESEKEIIPKSSRSEKIVKTESETKLVTIKPAKGRTAKKTVNDVKKLMTEFVNEQKTEILNRKSNEESKVPYKELSSLIMLSNAVAKKGRLSLSDKSSQDREKLELTKKLESLEFFQCGNCMKNITKTEWRNHVIEHAGVCWLENFEPAMNLDDWNESLRRIINVFKLYGIVLLTCTKCGAEKRSALGHLSHILICGESDEVLERRKIPCDLCNEKIFPFATSFHRTKCPALVSIKQEKIAIEVIQESVDLNVTEFSTTGRQKRQATRK